MEDFERFLEKHSMRPYRRETSRILVVDDEVDVLVPICRMLARSGYSVETACDGFEAGIKVGVFRPDLVLLDLYMPQLDGFAVCRALRGSPSARATRILVMTGDPDPTNVDKALAAGADEVLIKPFRLTALAAMVARLLRGEGATASAG